MDRRGWGIDPREEMEIIDPEALGIRIYGLNVRQIRKLMDFYQSRTGDLDFEKL